MAITSNTSKPNTSYSNLSRVVNYETFDTLTTTFDTEVRTFDQMGITWTDTSKPTTNIINITKVS